MTTPRLRLAALLIAAALAGCSSSETNNAVGNTPAKSTAPSPMPAATTAAQAASVAPTAEPRTYEAVKAVVDRIEAAAAALDGGTLWETLTSTAQAAISRDDYLKVVKECPKLFSGEPVISIALNAGGTTATVTASASREKGGGTFTWQMVYENGHWKHQPSDGAMSWIVLGADKALTVLRNDGAC